MPWHSDDLTARRGIRLWPSATWVVGPVEHFAGVDDQGHVHVAWWSPGQDWNADDISNHTGMTVPGGVSSWVTGSVEHLAGVDEVGHLLLQWWDGAHPEQGWRGDDLTENRTGQELVRNSGVTPWVVGDVEHLAGVDGDNHAHIFWWRPGAAWQTDDLTNRTGTEIATGLANWTLPDGEHLAGVDGNGHLQVLSWQGDTGWRHSNDVSQETGVTIWSKVGIANPGGDDPDGYLSTYPATCWVVGDVVHLASIDSNLHLRVFWKAPGQSWQSYDLSGNLGLTLTHDAPGPVFPSAPVSWVNGAVEHLALIDGQGHLRTFWYWPGQQWGTEDLSAELGFAVQGLSAPWAVGPVDHFVAMDAAGHTRVIWFSP